MSWSALPTLSKSHCGFFFHKAIPGVPVTIYYNHFHIFKTYLMVPVLIIQNFGLFINFFTIMLTEAEKKVKTFMQQCEKKENGHCCRTLLEEQEHCIVKCVTPVQSQIRQISWGTGHLIFSLVPVPVPVLGQLCGKEPGWWGPLCMGPGVSRHSIFLLNYSALGTS